VRCVRTGNKNAPAAETAVPPPELANNAVPPEEELDDTAAAAAVLLLRPTPVLELELAPVRACHEKKLGFTKINSLQQRGPWEHVTEPAGLVQPAGHG